MPVAGCAGESDRQHNEEYGETLMPKPAPHPWLAQLAAPQEPGR